MKISIAMAGKKEREEIDLTGHSVGYRPEERVFWVTVPMFDDWHQTVDYRFDGPLPALHFGHDLTLLFNDVLSRDAFVAWLHDAFAKATKGYRTMWP